MLPGGKTFSLRATKAGILPGELSNKPNRNGHRPGTAMPLSIDSLIRLVYLSIHLCDMI